MVKKVFIALLCLSCLFILTACGVSRMKKQAIIKEYKPKVLARFRELGYKGQVEIEDYWWTSESGELLKITYTEEVEGRPLEFTNVLSIDTEPYDAEDKYKFENRFVSDWFSLEEMEIDIDWMIRTEAMWQQKEVQKQFKKIRKSFQTMEDEKLELTDVSGNLASVVRSGDQEIVWQDVLQGQRDLLQDVENNQAASLPLNGYYHVDIPKYLKSHVLEIRVDFDWHLSKEENDDEKATREEFFEKVKAVDFSGFWDGYYVVGFDRRIESVRSGSILDMIVLDIRDGKLVRTFSAL